MNEYTVYNPVTGEIIQYLMHHEKPENTNWIIGKYLPTDYYVDVVNKVAVALPAKPIGDYTFDYTSKTWLPTPVPLPTEPEVRRERDFRLKAVDNVSPVRWASLTTEQQQELQTYRQALLDVPSQSGFPTAVEWPIKPLWL